MTFPLLRNPHPPDLPFAPIRVPGSKSDTNRALLLAALAPGDSLLRGGLDAEDTRWMRSCLKACGVDLTESPREWQVSGGGLRPAAEPLAVGASGTTLRFLLPVLALHAPEPVRFEGDARLFERPLEPLIEALAPLGVRWNGDRTGGWLQPTSRPPKRLEATVDASLSSQFLTGLALAAASLPQGGEISWKGTPTSLPYLDLTDRWLHAFGCPSQRNAACWCIPGGSLRPQTLDLPGDWSGAAAFLGAAAVTGRPARLIGLDPQEPQGDRALPALLVAAGCHVRQEHGELLLEGPLTRGLEADLSGCPDLGPVLATVAALAPGPSRLEGLHTLPFKECDRLDASAELVRWLGGAAQIVERRALHIDPGPLPPLERPPFDPRRDHRMAFAAAVGGLRAGGAVRDPTCVAKTFPTFWDTWERFVMG